MREEVKDLIGAHDPERAVLGVDETLDELQRGRVRELVINRDFTGTARQCSKCGWVSRATDRWCELCGSKRRSRTLRTLIPELASRFDIPMEVVAGKAAAKLRKHGGIGGWIGAGKKRAQKANFVTASLKGKRTA